MRFIQIRLLNEGTSRPPVATRKLEFASGHLSEMPTLRLRAFHKLVRERHFPPQLVSEVFRGK